MASPQIFILKSRNFQPFLGKFGSFSAMFLLGLNNYVLLQYIFLCNGRKRKYAKREIE